MAAATAVALGLGASGVAEARSVGADVGLASITATGAATGATVASTEAVGALLGIPSGAAVVVGSGAAFGGTIASTITVAVGGIGAGTTTAGAAVTCGEGDVTTGVDDTAPRTNHSAPTRPAPVAAAASIAAIVFKRPGAQDTWRRRSRIASPISRQRIVRRPAA